MVEIFWENCLTIFVQKIILIFLFLTSIFLPHLVIGQEKASTDYYNELLQKYRYYQSLIEVVNTQKNRHSAYKTVSTQADLLNEIKKFIAAEIDAMSSYILFVKSALAEATQIINYKENYLYVMLDEELAYLSFTKKNIESLGSLSDAQKLLFEIETHYQKVSRMGHQVKSIIELGSINKISDNIKIESDKIDGFLSEIKSDEARVLASREKFSANSATFKIVQEQILQVEKTLKAAAREADYRAISEQVHRTVIQAIVQFEEIVENYKNIVQSLK